jgi:hypothetical protein
VNLHRSIQPSLVILVALAVAPHAFAGGGARTISAISKGAGITFVDADRSGKPSVGDYEIGSSVYVSPKSGKVIGHGSIMCTQIDTVGGSYQCQGVTHFAGGDVVTAGLFSPASKTGSQAIVGGTGVYAGVDGLVTVTWLDTKFARARVVLTLQA